MIPLHKSDYLCVRTIRTTLSLVRCPGFRWVIYDSAEPYGLALARLSGTKPLRGDRRHPHPLFQFGNRVKSWVIKI
jgi:hypothetical protein